MPESKSGESRIVVLDALRGLAAVGVAYFYHWIWLFGMDDRANRALFPGAGLFFMSWLYTYGYLLVELFFVLSGFIFMHVYFDKINNSEIDFIKYIKLRVARLWPTFLVSSLIVFVLQIYRLIMDMGVFYPQIPFRISDIFLSFGFLQSGIFNASYSMNFPLWSVCVEMVMYVLFFLAIKSSLRFKWSFSALTVGLLCVGIAIAKVQTNFLLLNPFISRAIVGFFSGVLLALFYKKLSDSRLVRGNNRILLTWILILTLLLFGLIWLQIGVEIFGNLNMVYSMFVFPVLIVLCLNSKVLNTLATLKPVKTLGDMSYSIYAMSFPVVLAVSTVFESRHVDLNFYSGRVVVMYALIGLSVSYLYYRFFEKRLSVSMKRVLKV